MLKIIGIAIVGVIAAVLVFAAMGPDTFRVARSTEIKAPPETIFAYINDFKAWTKWSPYEKMDPSMQRTYGGADEGQGSTYAWSGNNKAGAGSMEITESSAPSKVVLNLNFTKPFETKNVVTFTLTPQDDVTQVTWAMDGPMPYVSKLMSLFFNMDSMIGGDFETGLADLKKISEQ